MAQLEKETKDLLRWKSIAKHLELEAREAYRWKSLLRTATMAKESKWSHDGGGDALHSKLHAGIVDYRRRTRAYEKELVELRAWRHSRSVTLNDSNGLASNAAGGDFYTSTPTGVNALGLGLAYDNESLPSTLEHESLMMDSFGGDEDPIHAKDDLEPLPDYMHEVLAEESKERELGDGSALRSTPPLTTSDELYAAELEEERLLANFVATNGSTANANSATRTAESEEEELFQLGEALVRRNQHLHQHRLMTRYQNHPQQQQQPHPHSQSQSHMPLTDSIGGLDGQITNGNVGVGIPSTSVSLGGMNSLLSSSSSTSSSMLTANSLVAPSASPSSASVYQTNANKSGLTGVLQASAPVFTPRYQVDPNTATTTTATSTNGIGTHYTKIVPSTNLPSAYTPASSPLEWTNSSSASTLPSALDVDSPTFWNSSLQSLLDDMSISSASTSATTPMSSNTTVRARAFSNPIAPMPVTEQASVHLHANPSGPHPHPPLPSHPGTNSSLHFGLSNLGVGGLGSLSVPDPFNGFRRTQGLVLIDDRESESDVNPSDSLTRSSPFPSSNSSITPTSGLNLGSSSIGGIGLEGPNTDADPSYHPFGLRQPLVPSGRTSPSPNSTISTTSSSTSGTSFFAAADRTNHGQWN